jgi:hypothetical protein
MTQIQERLLPTTGTSASRYKPRIKNRTFYTTILAQALVLVAICQKLLLWAAMRVSLITPVSWKRVFWPKDCYDLMNAAAQIERTPALTRSAQQFAYLNPNQPPWYP